MKNPRCTVWVDLKTYSVTRLDLPSMEIASKTLSWYAVEAPEQLNTISKIIRIRRARE